MGITLSTGAEIVKEICNQVGDPNLTKYADSTSYEGRAFTLFLRAIRDILKKPKIYDLTKHDYRGMFIREELAIGDSIAGDENGQILFSNFSLMPKEIIDINVNSDSSNDQLPYNIKKINSEYPQYAEHEENKDNYFYTPLIDTDADRGWYEDDTLIQFYPVEGTGTGEYYVTVEYVGETDPDSYDKDTAFYIGDTNGLFTEAFIDKAIDITVNKILSEREI